MRIDTYKNIFLELGVLFLKVTLGVGFYSVKSYYL
jgi:hypothetical protein